MEIYRYIVAILLFLSLNITFPLYSQDSGSESDDNVVIETPTEEDSVTAEEAAKSRGRFHFFLDNKLLFAFSVPDGGFGFAETANFQYILPFNLAFGLEGGYYGFRGGIEGEGISVVAGYTLIPLYATASFNIPIVDNFYITPVLKGGGAYTNARINGWLGGDSFSGIFEGGVRFKAYMKGGLLIHGGIMYTGLIEKSGLFSIMSIGFGFGL